MEHIFLHYLQVPAAYYQAPFSISCTNELLVLAAYNGLGGQVYLEGVPGAGYHPAGVALPGYGHRYLPASRPSGRFCAAYPGDSGRLFLLVQSFTSSAPLLLFTPNDDAV